MTLLQDTSGYIEYQNEENGNTDTPKCEICGNFLNMHSLERYEGICLNCYFKTNQPEVI